MQRGHVFPDNKTFVGAAPRQRPATILATWQREKAQPGFQLKAFVTARFDLPTDGAVPFQSNVAAGLRHHEKADLATLLRRLRAEGVTILLVEHDMEFVMGLAERLVVMDFGTKLADGPPDHIRHDPRVIAAAEVEL